MWNLEKNDKDIAKITYSGFKQWKTTKIAIKIVQCSAVIQNALGGLIIHNLCATSV